MILNFKYSFVTQTGVPAKKTWQANGWMRMIKNQNSKFQKVIKWELNYKSRLGFLGILIALEIQ